MHEATRVKGPEAADVDNKACTEAFQQLLSNLPWTRNILKMCCRRRVHIHFCFMARGSTLVN